MGIEADRLADLLAAEARAQLFSDDMWKAAEAAREIADEATSKLLNARASVERQLTNMRAATRELMRHE